MSTQNHSKKPYAAVCTLSFFRFDTKRCNCARAMFCINLEKKKKYIFRTFRVKESFLTEEHSL